MNESFNQWKEECKKIVKGMNNGKTKEMKEEWKEGGTKKRGR